MKGNKTKKQNKTPRSSLMLLLGVTLLLCACGSRELYNESIAITETGWSAQDSKTFTIDMQSQQPCDIEIFVRHTTQYPYRNLWLFVEHTAPDSTINNDTINIAMADKYGNWNGSGWGSHHQIQHTLHHALPLDSGTHIVKITQGMREEKIKGIANIGVKVTPVNN